MVPGIYEFDNLKGPLKGTASAQILASKKGTNRYDEYPREYASGFSLQLSLYKV